MKTKIFFIVLISTITFSCRKKGCTNSTASNYDAEAKKDDNSCTYTANVIFWQDSTSGTAFYNEAVSYFFDLYIDDKIAGNGCSAFTYTNSVPKCGDNGIINCSVNLGNETSKKVDWQILDDNNTILFQGSFYLNKDACTIQKIAHQ